MKDWFTVEKIDNNTFAISEYKHWEETHCYLLCGNEKAILIDTGLGVENIKEITDSLTKLPIMVITTHVHWDHIGGHKFFDNIAVYEAEKNWLAVKFPIPLPVVKQRYVLIAKKNLSLQATDRFSVQRTVAIRQGRTRQKPTEKQKKEIIIIVSVSVLCVAVPTGLHTVSRNSVPKNVKR